MQKETAKIDLHQPVANVSSLINLVKTDKQIDRSTKRKNQDQSISQPAKMLNTRTQSPLPQHNRFEPLAEECIDEMETENVSQPTSYQPSNKDTDTAKKSKPPPPIIIQKKPNDHKKFISELQQKIKKGFHIKYTLNHTNLFLHDIQEWRMYKDEIELDNTPFYTFTPYEEREHAFVIRGLDNEPTEEELTSILKHEHDINITKCYKLRTRRPLYLISTSKEYNLKMLNTRIKYLNHTRIVWERRNTNRNK